MRRGAARSVRPPRGTPFGLPPCPAFRGSAAGPARRPRRGAAPRRPAGGAVWPLPRCRLRPLPLAPGWLLAPRAPFFWGRGVLRYRALALAGLPLPRLAGALCPRAPCGGRLGPLRAARSGRAPLLAAPLAARSVGLPPYCVRFRVRWRARAAPAFWGPYPQTPAICARQSRGLAAPAYPRCCAYLVPLRPFARPRSTRAAE